MKSIFIVLLAILIIGGANSGTVKAQEKTVSEVTDSLTSIFKDLKEYKVNNWEEMTLNERIFISDLFDRLYNQIDKLLDYNLRQALRDVESVLENKADKNLIKNKKTK